MPRTKTLQNMMQRDNAKIRGKGRSETRQFFIAVVETVP